MKDEFSDYEYTMESAENNYVPYVPSRITRHLPIQEDDNFLDHYRYMPYLGAILIMFFMAMLTIIISVIQ